MWRGGGEKDHWGRQIAMNVPTEECFISPDAGLRVNATPVPESSPLLPNTIDWTLTAVPRSSSIFSMRR